MSTREIPLVLVADDDLVMRATMAAVLEESGYAVIVAEDGVEALAIAMARLPDLIVLDLVMPGLDGFEVCQRLRADRATMETPILVLTGIEDTIAIRRAFEIGATDFATKPLSAPLLSHRVRFMLRSVDAVRELRDSESRLADAQRLARLGNWEWEIESGTLVASREALALLGLADRPSASPLLDFRNVIAAEDLPLAETQRAAVVAGGNSLDFTCRIATADARPLHVHLLGQVVDGPVGAVRRMAGTVQDVTERTRAEDRIKTLAYYDTLTGLPNRLHFSERTRAAIALARRNGSRIALLLVDLDNFKGINDTLGHAVGDSVLREVGARLRDVVREYDTVGREGDRDGFLPVSRLGGDEFLIAIGELESGAEAASVAARVLDVLRVPLTVESKELFVGASIGISVYPDDGADFEEIFKHADIALYHAKSVGGNTSEFFDASMNEAAMYRLLIETSLRRSLERQEMTVHYQPQVDVVTGQISGVEALIRWSHPDIGSVSPATFIPLAERIGMIAPLTEFVMHRACAQMREWQSLGAQDLRIAINLSAQLFRQRDVLQHLSDIPASYGVHPTSVEFEITETTLLENPADAGAILSMLRGRGFRIALDDFGMGYSSLSHLRQFSLDTLKIDRSFISDLVSGTRELEIVGALISLAHKLGIEPLAEGIENVAQRDLLLDRGCRMMQGYLVGRPLPPEQLTARLVAGEFQA